MVEIDDNNPRGLWKKVLIKSIEPSNDGLIRKFSSKTAREGPTIVQSLVRSQFESELLGL